MLSRHFPFISFSEDWSDDHVWIVGGGPSLRDFDFSKISEDRVVGVNKSAFLHRTPYLMSLDQRFCQEYRVEISGFLESGGTVYVGMPDESTSHTPVEGVRYLQRINRPFLIGDPARFAGQNSGIFALQVAACARPKEIRLLGFDMKYSSDGRVHYHDSYPWQNPPRDRWQEIWAKHISEAIVAIEGLEIPVVNYVGSEGSRVRCRREVKI